MNVYHIIENELDFALGDFIQPKIYCDNPYQTYKRKFGIAHGERRQKICKEGDVGRYKV